MNNELFIGIYLDEDVATLVGTLLTAQGYRAITARDAGQLGKPDTDQLAYTVKERLTVLTHNRNDFEELHRQYLSTRKQHTGILSAVRRSPYQIASRLLELFNQTTADEMRNQLLYV